MTDLPALDVHMLLSDRVRQDWQREALLSLSKAVKLAPMQVNVYHASADFEHLGRARRAGYNQGVAGWKAYVDEDDIVLPDAFQVLGRHLHQPVAVVTCQEYVMQNGRFHGHLNRRHHLQCYRADLVQSFALEDWKVLPDLALQLHSTTDPRGALDLDDTLYIHRIYANSNGRKARMRAPHERQRIVDLQQRIQEGTYR